MSFVEKTIILCPYLGGSTIGGSTVYLYIHILVYTVDQLHRSVCHSIAIHTLYKTLLRYSVVSRLYMIGLQSYCY